MNNFFTLKNRISGTGITYLIPIMIFCFQFINAQSEILDNYNISWETQSLNSSESMPCGGGDIGLNVWVENGEIMFYFSRSGTFDENNTFLKLGRVRIKLTPNQFKGDEFKQELKLSEGYVEISGNNNTSVKVWTDVFNPVIHVEISGNENITAEVVYESWRFKNKVLRKNESFANSYKWAPPKGLMMLKDTIRYHQDGVLFYHRNSSETIFDVSVHQQGMDGVKNEMNDPLRNLTFGGIMTGDNMLPSGIVEEIYQDTEFKGWKLKSKSSSHDHHIKIILYTNQSENEEKWLKELELAVYENENSKNNGFVNTVNWWHQFWKRSYIIINPKNKEDTSSLWQMGRNYQLFRYMLGCNAYGGYPTKFNGGLFTYDPCFTDSDRCFTPDYRNWGGGTFTAQNQRLVYFPMIKSGDFDMMKSQFDFYLNNLRNAELRSKVYWGHDGACFTEQIENFGLPNCSEYGWNRPEWYDKGMQYNAWLEYQWDTALEFCFMILEMYRYTGNDITEYLPLIEGCITFFEEHYLYLAKQRGRQKYDANGNLVFYPGSSCETYKMAYNATSTLAALLTVINRLLELPENIMNSEIKEKYREFLDRIPPIEFRKCNGYTTIAPAKLWERINNTEVPQLYPVFPWSMYGVGKPGLDTALNTWKYDPDAIKFRGYVGWKQDNIFAARLGLTDEALKYTTLKLRDSDRRFPAFWGPGFDWVPDHNWGGSGMIGLQEMLLQTNGKKIILLPAWPKDIDVHFKLHAPLNTTVEMILTNGKVEMLKVIPESRQKDVVIIK